MMKSLHRFFLVMACLFPVGQAWASYSCTVTPSNIWSSGYQLDVTVTNDGPAAIAEWEVVLDFGEPANVTSSWNVEVSGGDTVTPSFSNCCSWNGNLAVGQSAGFGFQGTHDGSFELPVCTGSGTPPGGSSSSSSSSGSSSSSSGSGSGGNSFLVRARGTSGQESVTLAVGGTALETWTLAGNMQDYTATSALGGEITLEFTNDNGTDRDVQVDYIQVNGETRQAEDQAVNTGAWGNDSCGGGSNSEWLHCSGYIGFGAVSGGGSSSSSSSSGSSSSGSGGSSGGENSGRDCAVPSMPSYSQLPDIGSLPDPFRSMSGTDITSRDEWTCRRAEISAQAQHYELGEKPAPETASVSGSGNGSGITVNVSAGGNSISFNASISLPTTGQPPYPAMIGMGGSNLNNDALRNRGVAVINFPNSEIAEQLDGGSRGQGKFYQLYGSSHSAGAMSAWAWGVSRLIDALEQTPGSDIDPSRLGVTGCSRNGKGALIAGALDERIDLTIPQESGSGGAAAWRVSDAQRAAGQNVQTLSQIVTENVWFRDSFSQFSNAATRLPFDHHEVMGLVAPRALLVIENTDMEWLGNESTYTASVVAREIWHALGIPDHMGVSQVGGHSHCQFPSSQQAELDDFVDRFLIGSGSANTNVVRTDGNFSVDRGRWVNWDTPALQ
ncbi:cellulose binding domain-containing protein [Microbulbifer litoralis]|uniref:glucuronyl esterase domain-containing protein n=1 Tax=Microbulbifer litoralis TaxID=2933965 RepID=UPI002027CFC1|nr:cellulose binding domain-containing protein [Microbulbifer sp. GX H0434]